METNAVADVIAAVTGNDVERITALFRDHPELRAQINEPVPGFHFDATILQPAVAAGNRSMIDALVAAGADINVRTGWWAGGFGVMEYADAELVPFLLERGAAMTIHGASRLGRRDDVEHLLNMDPSLVHARGGDGKTPLHYAATVEIARMLLDHGADIDALDVDHESTPAQYLVREHPDVARLLVAHGCRTDILMAAALGELAVARSILDADPAAVAVTVWSRSFPMRDPRAGGTIYIWTLGAGKSPHLLAREFEHDAIFDLLMERSPTSVKLATLCELGDEEACDALLAQGPDIAASLTDHERARLVGAAERNATDGVRLMLQAGWPVNATNDTGATALHWAAFLGNAEMTRAILEHAPNLEAVERQFGSTPLGWAKFGGDQGWNRKRGDHRAVIDMLLHAGAIGMDRD
jgi:ankyrin repeat protein